MNKDPLVSILIPNYNKASYIRETLDSVLAQTYSNWECIIVDDHSTDNSFEIIEEYTDKDSRFRMYKRPSELPNGGNACRNYALSKSKSKFCLFLDADDILKHFCLEQRVSKIKEFPKLDFWVFNVEIFQKEIGDLGYLWNIETEENDLKRFLKTDGVWQTSGPIYNVDFLNKIGYFNVNLKIWQDYELHARSLIYNGKYKKFFFLNRDAGIRVNHKSLSYRGNSFGRKKILIQRIYILEQIYLMLRNKNIEEFNKYKEIFYSVDFLLVSRLFLKYGNWNKFKYNWKRNEELGLISKNKYLLGILSCLILKMSNNFFSLKFIFDFKIFNLPNLKVLECNLKGKVKV